MAEDKKPAPTEAPHAAHLAALKAPLEESVAPSAKAVSDHAGLIAAVKENKTKLVGNIKLADGTTLTDRHFDDIVSVLENGHGEGATAIKGLKQLREITVPGPLKAAVTGVKTAVENDVSAAGLTRAAGKVEETAKKLVGEGVVDTAAARDHFLAAANAKGITFAEAEGGVNIASHLTDDMLKAEKVKAAAKGAAQSHVTEYVNKAADLAVEGLGHAKGLGQAFASRFGKNGVGVDGTQFKMAGKFKEGSKVALGVAGFVGGTKMMAEGMFGKTDSETGEKTDPSVGKTIAGLGIDVLSVPLASSGAFGKWDAVWKGVSNAAKSARV